MEDGIHASGTSSVDSTQVLIVKQLLKELLVSLERSRLAAAPEFGRGFRLAEYLKEIEKEAILHALYLARHKQVDAAKMLGVNPSTLHAKIARLGVS